MKRIQQAMGWGLAPLLTLGLVAPAWADVVDITLLHLNDVYEITPVQGGTRGGLARVAFLRQQLQSQNPHTYTILAGDLVSPSALGTARVDGERLAGRQIVSVMNQLGLDFATFGNHEFDLSQEQFDQRLQESQFQWFSSNVTDETGAAFPNVPSHVILEVEEEGEVVRVGLIGLTLPSNPKEYVGYRDITEAAREQIEALDDAVDILVAVTHLSIEQDRELATTFPQIDLILGGHEHENIQQWRFVNRPATETCERNTTPIFKADANATTVYVHTLRYDTDTDCLAIASNLEEITADIPDDPETAELVQDWLNRGFEGFRADGFEPEAVVATITEPLDGLESSVRNQSTALTTLIADAIVQAGDRPELALFNSGSIRVDDVLPPGPVTQYDVIRILPFGGKVLTVNIRGDILQQVLEIGQSNRGSGGYLQMANVSQVDGVWQIQGQPLEPTRTYRVAVNDFLVSGRETNLGFLKLGESGIELVTEGEDVRFALIEALRSQEDRSPSTEMVR